MSRRARERQRRPLPDRPHPTTQPRSCGVSFFWDSNIMNKALAVIGCIIETAAIEGADFIQQAIVDCGPAGKWQGVGCRPGRPQHPHR